MGKIKKNNSELKKGMILDGVFASEAVDTSGEILSISGCDISDLEEGRGTVNYEHSNDSPEDVLGKIVFARKIFGPKDCEDDRQLMYWKKVKLPFIYGKAELFDTEGHPGAAAAAAIVRYYKSRGEPVLARWSIEGTTLDRNGNHLEASVAKNVALTLKPCNRSCHSDLIEDARVVSDGEVRKNQHPERKLTKGEFVESDPVVEDPFGGQAISKALEAIRQLAEIAALAKTITAGSYAGDPGSRIQGSALQSEHMENKGQALAALRDWDRATPIKKFLKHRLPEASDEYINTFAHLVDDFEMKKAEGLFGALGAPAAKPSGRKNIHIAKRSIESSIASKGYGEKIKSSLSSVGHADLVLFDAGTKPASLRGRAASLPMEMPGGVRLFTFSRPQAQTVLHWATGAVVGDTKKYSFRARNPLVVEGPDQEAALWSAVGDHASKKHGHLHRSKGLNDSWGTSLHAPKNDPELEYDEDGCVAWHQGEGMRTTSSRQFLGEYLLDHGHDAAVFLSSPSESGELCLPSMGISFVAVPSESLGKSGVPGSPGPRERGYPRPFALDKEHGAEGSYSALEDGEYLIVLADGRHPFRFFVDKGLVYHLEDHDGGRWGDILPEGPQTSHSVGCLGDTVRKHGATIEFLGLDVPDVPADPEPEPKIEAEYEVEDELGKRKYHLCGDKLCGEDGVPLSEDEQDTLLDHVASGAIVMREITKDLLSGGKGDGPPSAEADPGELEDGRSHEMEHTDDPNIAEEIARDHLTENPKYYKDLAELEGKKANGK